MKRVALLQLFHESNTFNRLLTDEDAFRQRFLFRGAEMHAIRDMENEISGFLDVLTREGITPVPLICGRAAPGGPVARDFYVAFRDEAVARLKEAVAGGIDAVLVSLHGAMVVDGFPDAQGDLLRSLRAVIGPDMPMVGTYDFHANMNADLVHTLDGLVTYRTHPHEDMEETGRRGARLLLRLVREGRPWAQAFHTVPVLLPPTNTRTADPNSPMSALIRLAEEYERDPDVFAVSVFMGYPNADTPDTGASVAVTARSPEKARDIARTVARAIWERRFELTPPLPTFDEALDMALASTDPRPVILGETSDSVLQGGASDGTYVLRRLLERGVERAAHAAIYDPAAVAQAIAAGVGNEVELELGGKVDTDNFQPLPLRARVRAITDGNFTVYGPVSRGHRMKAGRTVRLQAGGVHVVVTENRISPFAPELLMHVGIDPASMRVLALKGGIVARSAYGDRISGSISFESPGWATCDYRSLPYRHVRRPIFPLDDDAAFE